MEFLSDTLLQLPTCSNIPSEITANSTIVEEGPRLCPLCNSIIKQFFIDFHHKILMCENVECEFPFGYEEMQIFLADEQDANDIETMSLQSKSSQGSNSLESNSTWLDIAGSNKPSQSEDNQSTCSLRSTRSNRERIQKRQKARATEEKLRRNVAKIKELNQILYEEQNEKYSNIKSAEWITNLLKMQKSSGLQLLKEQELKKVQRQEPAIGVGELKVNIDGQNDSVTSIKIDIVN